MSTTTKKHANYVAEPLQGKPATAVPGIGKVSAERLASKGIEKASQVQGVQMAKGNDAKFKEWVQGKCGANEKQQNDANQACKDWANNH